MDNTIIFSQILQKVLVFAEESAPAYGSSYIGSEHIIFAILNCPECTAYKILSDCNVSEPSFNEYFIRSIDKSCTVNGYMPRTKRIIENSVDLSNGGTVRTEHMLLAILQSGECLAMRILRYLGVDVRRLILNTEFIVNLGVEQ